nr:DNA mismatch endonuclease Vsr [uncultured Halomonas sp.]
MADTLSKEARSERMSRVRGKDTKPEMKLRRLVHGMGFRYRLHDQRLPGKPDMVFRSRHAVVFMHGCFWHRHEGCKLARIPKSRISFWLDKLEANRQRDRRNQLKLQELGWRVLIVWECQLAAPERTALRVRDFLNDKAGLEHDEIG